MAAEQPFLQNESSGLPPACKPKLQQAGVYYLVFLVFKQILMPKSPENHEFQSKLYKALAKLEQNWPRVKGRMLKE